MDCAREESKLSLRAEGPPVPRSRDRAPTVDRVIVLGLLAGAWWALLATELVEAEVYQRDAAMHAGPDWDVRTPLSERSPWRDAFVPAPYPRALRQARGVGRRRSLDLTRYFQAHGEMAPPSGLYGIGTTTAAAVGEVLGRLEVTTMDAGGRDPEDPFQASGASPADG